MKISVMGTGGVGGYFGGLLARAGHDLTYVARGRHLAEIQKQGHLIVESSNQGTFQAPGRALEDTSTAGVQDLVLFTVKMHHNPAAIEAVRPLVGPETVVLTLQNGIDNGNQLARGLGRAPVMLGSAYMEGRIKEPGAVTQGGPGIAGFGEMEPGISVRGEKLLAIFLEAGWRVELHENMPGMMWKKFAYIAGSAAVNAATGTVYEEMRTIPETRALIQGAIEEALAVGRSSGAPIMDDSLDWAMTSLDGFPGQGKASLAKDFLENKPVELEGLTGILVRMGREFGVPTPINDVLYAVLKPAALRIEAGTVT